MDVQTQQTVCCAAQTVLGLCRCGGVCAYPPLIRAYPRTAKVAPSPSRQGCRHSQELHLGI